MSKYFYEITGDYKDHLKMKKEGSVIHEGNLIGLISYTNERLELNLNYGKGTCKPCEIKKISNLIITVPIKEYLCKADYQYKPLVFELEEYEQLTEISYIDRELLNNIHQVNKQDILNLLMMCFKLEFGILEVLDFKDIFNNIVASSENDDKVTDCIYSSLRNEIVNIQKLDEVNSVNITLYIDFMDKLFEWNNVIKNIETYYFILIDDYVISIN